MLGLKKQILASCGAGNQIDKDTPINLSFKVGNKDCRYTVYFSPQDKLAMLDIAKVSDIIFMVCSPDPKVTVSKGNFDLGFFDEIAHLLTLLKTQGVPHVVPIIQGLGLNKYNAKQQSLLMKGYERYFQTEYTKKLCGKPCNISNVKEVEKMWRFLSLKKHFSLEWRHRPYLLTQHANFVPNKDKSGKGLLQVVGHLRGDRCLHPNRLVHITGLGDFQVEEIEIIPEKNKKKIDTGKKKGDSEMDNTEEKLKFRPDKDQDPLKFVEDVDKFATVNDQSMITEEEIQQSQAETLENNKKKLMEQKRQKLNEIGMSDYGLAWDQALGVIDEEAENMAEENKDTMAEANKKVELDMYGNPMNTKEFSADPETLEDKQALVVPDKELSKEEMLALQKRDEADEKEWPDEVNTPLDQAAKLRFDKYRGLENFARSEWDVHESLPIEYSRIIQFENYRAMVNGVKEDLSVENNSGGVKPNQLIKISIRNVPTKGMEAFSKNNRPLIISGLYKYEHKATVMHYTIKKHPEYTDPIKRKTNLLFQTGFRRFTARPVWSYGKKRKFLCSKYLHDDEYGVATIYGRVEVTPCPTMYFSVNEEK
eukprot:UN25671